MITAILGYLCVGCGLWLIAEAFGATTHVYRRVIEDGRSEQAARSATITAPLTFIALWPVVLLCVVVCVVLDARRAA